jgi:intron-binding protein aquarius
VLELAAGYGEATANENQNKELATKSATNGTPANQDAQGYCERFLELMIDLLSQLPTRRYFNILFQDHLFVPIVQGSAYYKHPSTMFRDLFKTLRFYATFEIDDLTGVALSREMTLQARHEMIGRAQKRCFVAWPEELKVV